MGFWSEIGAQIKSIKRKDINVVVLCILAATTFWFLNALNDTYTTRIEYPIAFQFDRDEVVVTGDLPEKIALEVSGLGWNLFRRSFAFDTDPVVIDLDDPADVQYFSANTLQSRLQEFLGEIRINYIITDTLYLNFATRERKRLRVEIDSTDIPLEQNHFISDSITIRPDTLWVSGPQQTIADLADVYVLPLDIDDPLDESTDFDIPVSFGETRFISPEPSSIQVHIPVANYSRETLEVAIDSIDRRIKPLLSDSVVMISYMKPVQVDSALEDQDFFLWLGPDQVNVNDSLAQPKILAYPAHLRSVEVSSDSIVLRNEQ